MTLINEWIICRLIAQEIAKLQKIQPDAKYDISRQPVLFPQMRLLLQMAPTTFTDKEFQQKWVINIYFS